jgi:hypothetical protein
MVRLAQTMHLFSTDTNTVSKRTEMRFHKTHVTSVFYRVCLIWFLSLWYVRHKPCTYLASRLSLSPNRLKWASTWALSLSSTIGCVQNDFLSLWHVWRKPWTYLALTLTLYPNGLKWDSTWPMSSRRSIGCIQNEFWDDGMFVANCAPILRQD